MQGSGVASAFEGLALDHVEALLQIMRPSTQ